jgi:hypothetical protein
VDSLCEFTAWFLNRRFRVVNRIKIVLEQPEYAALCEFARLDLRSPDEQVRYVLRQEMIRRGLLADSMKPDEQTAERSAQPRAAVNV